MVRTSEGINMYRSPDKRAPCLVIVCTRVEYRYKRWGRVRRKRWVEDVSCICNRCRCSCTAVVVLICATVNVSPSSTSSFVSLVPSLYLHSLSLFSSLGRFRRESVKRTLVTKQVKFVVRRFESRLRLINL